LTASSLQDQATAIQTRARELGFERVGFAPASPPARADTFRRWLSEGKAGTMTYLNRSADRRSDPQLVLPGARTIISVAQSYFSGRLPADIRNDPSRGLIASYAWGHDYHDVLLKKLEALADFISSLPSSFILHPSSFQKAYTDTGPLLEREFGERAGIGFIGKNTLLIAPKMGSTFFLGEIITTLELPPSPLAAMPSCGSCTRCLDICPTHAFPTAFVLDSTLCISYLTIELKGVIPRALRSKMGNHIFGCDDCQDCCPWNQRFSTETREAAYRATLERQAPHLAGLARLSEAEFKEKFVHSPVLRPGYAGFLRNVAVALGNWATPEALDALEPLLIHPSPLVRLHAAWAAAQIPGQAARLRLQTMSETEQDPAVHEEIGADRLG
jgi:epoxyqueuosine reductase